MNLSESHTRRQLIDSRLAKAGWGVNDCLVINEFPSWRR
jgi:type I site-specific restriction endonuclease